MCAIASQITSLTIVCSNAYSGADQRKHQSSPSLVFGRGIHQWPVNSPHNVPVTWKMFPFDDVIMSNVAKLEIGRTCVCFHPVDTSTWMARVVNSKESCSRCACLLDSGGTIWLLWVYRDPVGIKIDSVGTSRRKWPALSNNVVF